MESEILEVGELDVDEPMLLEGFPGVGLVGTIATQYMRQKMDVEQVGHMDSEEFPPVAVVREGVVKLPVRIFQDTEHDLLLVVSELPIHPYIANDVASTLVRWAEGIGAREVVSLAGVGAMDSQSRVFGAATREGLHEGFPDRVQNFDSGNISGISGSMMIRSQLQGVDGLCILGETQIFAPDPRAAASVIGVLNEMYGFDVDTTELMEEADKIENQMRQLAEQTKQAFEEGGGRGEVPSPHMYG